MFTRLQKVSTDKAGMVINQSALHDATVTTVTKKYILEYATASAFVGLKVKNLSEVETTLTKPSTVTTDALLKAWIEDSIRALGFDCDTDHGKVKFPDVVVNDTSNYIWVYGEAIVTEADKGDGYSATTVKSDIVTVNTFKVTLGEKANPIINVNGTDYTISLTVTPGSTTAGALKTALELAIAALMTGSIVVYSTTTSYDATTELFSVTLDAVPATEITLDGVEADYTGSRADII